MSMVPDITATPPAEGPQRAPTRSGECPANQKTSPQAGWDARHCRSFSCASATHSWGQHQKRGGGGHGHRRSPGPEPAANIGTGEGDPRRQSGSEAPGNGGNGSVQTLSVFFLFWYRRSPWLGLGKGCGDPLPLLLGRVPSLVCWRNEPGTGDSANDRADGRPVAAQADPERGRPRWARHGMV